MSERIRLVWMALLPLASLVTGCSPKGDGDSGGSGCAGIPPEATDVDGTLSNDDTCGYWRVSVGEHIYINVAVSDEQVTCDATVGEGLDLPYSATYSNMDAQGPKWTFDVEAVSATDAQPATVDVRCDDGTRWYAHVDVVDA